MISNRAVTETAIVTVIIPTYNYAHFIGETLESVQAQSYRNWECLVVDDGSVDDTRAVVTSFAEKDGRIKYIHQVNQGSGAARNNGIRNSRGEYLQFLDADDLIEEKKLERQVEYMVRHPEVDIVYGSVRYFRTGHASERLHSSWGEDSNWMPEMNGDVKSDLLNIIHMPIVILAPLVRKSALDEVGFFDETLMPSEDWHLWIRCASMGKRFRYEDMEGSLALVRIHPTSMTANWRNGVNNTLRMRRKVREYLRDSEARGLNRRLESEYRGHAGIREVMEGNTARGMWQLFRAGLMTSIWRGRFKWFLCALAAPIVPKRRLIQFPGTPVRESLIEWLKRPFHTS